ncbi:unnamed protein product [Prunus armeniaca]|uniref:Protein kinase domain-containing protein n=1 Tax=Prunus armeniaca TaxID=36596 RepID=A0A6J5TUS4_PRUAR|nr:unnamed protein product [Prunus armeniaca]CAB4298274.1 unnamed protein product [Prunus armeniaca]
MLFHRVLNWLQFLFQRITIKEIKNHPWFLKNLPRELTEAAQTIYYRKENPTFSLQSIEDIMKIVEEAKIPPPVSRSIGGFGWGEEDGDTKEEVEGEEEEDEYEKTVKEIHASGEFKGGREVWRGKGVKGLILDGISNSNLI